MRRAGDECAATYPGYSRKKWMSVAKGSERNSSDVSVYVLRCSDMIVDLESREKDMQSIVPSTRGYANDESSVFNALRSFLPPRTQRLNIRNTTCPTRFHATTLANHHACPDPHTTVPNVHCPSPRLYPTTLPQPCASHPLARCSPATATSAVAPYPSHRYRNSWPKQGVHAVNGRESGG